MKQYLVIIALSIQIVAALPLLQVNTVLAGDTATSPEPTPIVVPTITPGPSRPPEPTRPAEPIRPTLPPTPTPYATPQGGFSRYGISSPTATPQAAGTVTDMTGGISGSYGVGDTTINTGDATVNASATTTGNTNVVSRGNGTGSTGSGVTNAGNGALSSNTGSVGTGTTNTTDLSNNANLDSGLIAVGNTGGNNASYITGGSGITTGDANVSGAVINGVNTNAFGSAEFTVAGDRVGDVTLLPATGTGTGCTASCVPGNLSAQNTDNGAFGTNNASASASQTTNTSLSNNAGLNSNLTLTAVTGNNDANYNTGTGAVNTGNANVAGTILNAANSNIVGGGLYVVNVVGNLVGDIILPMITGNSGSLGGSGGTSTTVANTGNGAGSQNSAWATTTNTNNTAMTNNASITSAIGLNGNTGSNQTDFNNGTNGIDTGNVTLSTNIVNVANVNASSNNKPIWLVFVNNLGEWSGQILGAAPGQTMAGSDGITFAQNADGTTTATNSNNGAFSNNNASVTGNNTGNTTMSNSAKITNNVTINADTGHNTASYNVGGSNIRTGNINAAVNIINFVNNNFSGRPVYVLIVNVFGKWFGNVVDKPRSHEVTSAQNIGGQSSNNQTDTNQQTAAVVNGQTATNTENTVSTQRGNILGTSLHRPMQPVAPVADNSVQPGQQEIIGLPKVDASPFAVASVTQGATSIYWPAVIAAFVLPFASWLVIRRIRNNRVGKHSLPSV